MILSTEDLPDLPPERPEEAAEPVVLVVEGDEFADLPADVQAQFEANGVSEAQYDAAPAVDQEEIAAILQARPECVPEAGELYVDALGACGEEAPVAQGAEQANTSPDSESAQPEGEDSPAPVADSGAAEPAGPSSPGSDSATDAEPALAPAVADVRASTALGGGGGSATVATAAQAAENWWDGECVGAHTARYASCYQLGIEVLVNSNKALLGSTQVYVYGLVTLSADSLDVRTEHRILQKNPTGYMVGRPIDVDFSRLQYNDAHDATPASSTPYGVLSVTTTPTVISGSYVEATPAAGEYRYPALGHRQKITLQGAYSVWVPEMAYGAVAYRCDNRVVADITPPGCVYYMSHPTVSFSKSGSEGAVASHIEKALALGAPPYLKREYPVGSNHDEVCPSSLVMPKGSIPYECDEYPFAEAVEGGTAYTTIFLESGIRSVTVPEGCGWAPQTPTMPAYVSPVTRCAVPMRDKYVAQNKLADFMEANRLMPGDEFAVKVVP